MRWPWSFGVFMYFPTLVEVPVARMFLDLGMHPGPLLAYLMADPELSLQSMLMVAAVIGRPKTCAYVALGGAVQHLRRSAVRRLGRRRARWSGWRWALAAFAAVLAVGLGWLHHRRQRRRASVVKPVVIDKEKPPC